MENALKAILIGAVTVIVLVVISLGFLILRQGQDTAKNAVNKIDNMNSQLAESDYTMYDGLEISGSEVANTIRKFKHDYIAIKVITGRDTTGTWYIHEGTENSGNVIVGTEKEFDLSNAIEPSKPTYINPTGRFTGSVRRDDNGSVSAIIFTQK